MAIPSYDYGYLTNPLYRKKALTGLFPDANLAYASMAAINEDKRARNFESAKWASENAYRQGMLAATNRELDITSRQADIANVAGAISMAKNWRRANAYDNWLMGNRNGLAPATPGGTTLAPQGGWFGEQAAQTERIAGGMPSPVAPGVASGATGLAPGVAGMAPGPMAPEVSIPPIPETLSPYTPYGELGAAGAGATTPTFQGAAGSLTSTTPTPAGAPGTVSGMLAAKPGSFSLEMGGGSQFGGGLVTAGAGVVGGMTGNALGRAVARATGLHPKTVGDIGEALGVFTAVTAATGGNFIAGAVAAAIDGIFNLF